MISAAGLLILAALPLVSIETDQGRMVVEVDTVRAPLTAANFLRYVDAGLYTDARFHRVVTPTNQPRNKVKIEVIQAGPAEGKKELPPIRLERTTATGLRHVDGAISMARDEPDTATADFFICLGAQPELDFGGKRNPDGQGFAAFGRVVQGLEVARRIQQQPEQDQKLKRPVRILRITRVP